MSQAEHEAVVKMMLKADFGKEQIQAALSSDSYDYVASTYYLLVEQRQHCKQPNIPPAGRRTEPVTPESLSPDRTPCSSPDARRRETVHFSSSKHKGSFARRRAPAVKQLSVPAEEGDAQPTMRCKQVVLSLLSARLRSPFLHFTQHCSLFVVFFD